ncbi:hypothetical protein CEQ21_24355 [Niallia circulans]|uniref:Uncharacterized protein n=1 Tax=Niallia circulans TaxID=1397 RepID=A0A553SNF1_NIACI|nr:hypothetical protein [Niallia circulans]TRZ38521.1 hypothetical protein CEQ21_24355 [Niallia circulans]
MAQNYTKVGWKDHILDGTKILQQGTPVSANNLNKMDAGIELAHQKLEGSSRQTQAISQGLQMLNGDVNAPISLQMEGRTLIPLQNSVLEAGKYYLQADKKTWFAVNGTGFKGIQKFTGLSGSVNLTRIANFEGKIYNSTLENPHKSMQGQFPTIQVPSAFNYENVQANVDRLKTLDGGVISQSSVVGNTSISQQLFSFNIIEEIEKSLGRIPGNTLAQKIQWAKENINKFTWYWHGYGSGPAGNKATVNLWYADSNKWADDAWGQKKTNTTSAISAVTNFQLSSEVPKLIDANGFYHLVAYADASDGVTISTIVTDYIELQIELKVTAILHAPRVPLYEVTKEHYDAALVTWSEDEVIRRYPMVEGVQHIQNPYVMAEGDNLVPPFSEWSLTNQNSVLLEPYKFSIDPTGQYAHSWSPNIPVIPNEIYTLYGECDHISGYYTTHIYDKDGKELVNNGRGAWRMPANAAYARIRATNGTVVAKMTFYNVILTTGGNVKPFVPRNPSYLFAETKLGAIGTAKDLLYDQDGKTMVRKIIEKDIALDGSKTWLYHSSQNGNVTAKIFALASNLPVSRSSILTKYNGKLMTVNSVVNDADTYNGLNATGDIYLTTPYDEMGLTLSTYAPTNDEVKAYFNGWKVKTVDSNGKPTAWKSIVDGTDAPTQTVTYVAANKATGYTPYILSYVLATPVVLECKYEGAITVNGLTQIEVGSGVVVREKVTAMHNSGVDGTSYINALFGAANTWLKYRTLNILAVYKNANLDSGWNIGGSAANTRGKVYASKRTADIDATAEYTISYLIYDRNQFTSNPVVASATFANSIRTALDDNIKATEDNRREITINAQLIYDMMKRLKAGGL